MNKDWYGENYFSLTGTSSFNKAHLTKIITFMRTKMKQMAARTVDFRASLSSIEIKFRMRPSWYNEAKHNSQKVWVVFPN